MPGTHTGPGWWMLGLARSFHSLAPLTIARYAWHHHYPHITLIGLAMRSPFTPRSLPFATLTSFGSLTARSFHSRSLMLAHLSFLGLLLGNEVSEHKGAGSVRFALSRQGLYHILTQPIRLWLIRLTTLSLTSFAFLLRDLLKLW